MLIGVVFIIGFIIMVFVGIVDMKMVVVGFGNNSIWLIVMVFFILRGFVKIGFGRCIVFYFVKLFGKKILGLVYFIVGVDLILVFVILSNIVCVGGIMFLIIKLFFELFGLKLKDGLVCKMGVFFVFIEF